MTRRILFCTIGTTPQVVTETVWALRERRKPPWIPDEVHVVTTTIGLPRVYRELQSPHGRLAPLFNGRLPPLTIHVPRRDGQPDIYLPPRAPGDWSEIPVPLAVPTRSVTRSLNAMAAVSAQVGAKSRARVPSGASPREAAAESGKTAAALADVNSEKDAAIMGDLILRLIAGFAKDDDTEVHVSLAGDRKTMSAHALLALTLVGRPGVEASHVLLTSIKIC